MHGESSQIRYAIKQHVHCVRLQLRNALIRICINSVSEAADITFYGEAIKAAEVDCQVIVDKFDRPTVSASLRKLKHDR